jgi:hypothetical protein
MKFVSYPVISSWFVYSSYLPYCCSITRTFQRSCYRPTSIIQRVEYGRNLRKEDGTILILLTLYYMMHNFLQRKAQHLVQRVYVCVSYDSRNGVNKDVSI